MRTLLLTAVVASLLRTRKAYTTRAMRLAAACVVVLTAASAQAALIVNGSFEDPIVPTGSFTNFPGGATAITGWTVVGVDSAVVSGTFTENGILFQAQNGNQWIDLAGVDSNSTTSGVTQDAPTTIGQKYELSFYVGSATDGAFFFPATVDLSIDGGARVSYTNPTAPANMLDWKLFTAEFTATNILTNITLYNGGATNNFNSALDNVSLSASAVPEPCSLALWSIGAAGMIIGAAQRRRKAKQPG